MLFCVDCRRELVGVKETGRGEAVVDLVEDPVMGWVLSNTVKRWRTKPVHLEQVECGCGRFDAADLPAVLASGRVVEVKN